jgi:hypothetical protein
VLAFPSGASDDRHFPPPPLLFLEAAFQVRPRHLATLAFIFFFFFTAFQVAPPTIGARLSASVLFLGGGKNKKASLGKP